MNIIIDYIPSVYCENEDAWFSCLKCGKCGRAFNDNGMLICDVGKTTDEVNK